LWGWGCGFVGWGLGFRFWGLEVGSRIYDLGVGLKTHRGFVGCEIWGSSLPGSVTYRGTSIIRNCLPLGPYGRPMPRTLWWS